MLIKTSFDTNPMPAPVEAAGLTNEQILLGPPISPLARISTYNDQEWEQFVREWAVSLTGEYRHVRRASGAGDQGRDVLGYEEEINVGGPWDNYQCKRYAAPLAPGDIWPELAKLCYYTFVGEYSAPRIYYFVASRGVGPSVLKLLEKPERLREGLITRWKTGGLLKVEGADLPLDGNLLSFRRKAT